MYQEIAAPWDYPWPEDEWRRAWCDACSEWEKCPCGCGRGWCRDIGEFTEPDGTEECSGFCGEPPEAVDDNRIDWMREERMDDERC